MHVSFATRSQHQHSPLHPPVATLMRGVSMPAASALWIVAQEMEVMMCLSEGAGAGRQKKRGKRRTLQCRMTSMRHRPLPMGGRMTLP